MADSGDADNNDDIDFGVTWSSAAVETTPLGVTNATEPELDSAADGELFKLVLNRVVVPVLFGAVTVVGLAGNGLVIHVILTKRRMRTVTNLLLLNLAVADLCFVLIVPPFTASQMALADWPFGDVACKLLHYAVNVTAYVTVYTLVLIAALRYATVVHTARTAPYRTKPNVVAAVCAIWVLMLSVNVPIPLSYWTTFEGTEVICDLVDPQNGRFIFTTFFGFGYVLPLGVIAVFSLCIVRHLALAEKSTALTLGASKVRRQGQNKKRHAGRLLVLVVVLFAILWLPVHIHLMLFFFDSMPTSRVYQAVSVLWNCLAYFNSCVNPIIYNHASKEFRDAFLEVIRCGRVPAKDAVEEADPDGRAVRTPLTTARTNC